MSCRVEIMFVKSDFSLRPMELRDKDSIRFWRNQPHVRDVMYTDHIITHEEHDTWFERAIQSPDAVYLILEHRDASVAFINFTSIDRKNNKCFWGFYLTYPPPQARDPSWPGFHSSGVSASWEFVNCVVNRLLSTPRHARYTANLVLHRKPDTGSTSLKKGLTRTFWGLDCLRTNGSQLDKIWPNQCSNSLDSFNFSGGSCA